MKATYNIVFAALGGAVVGASAVGVLHAQTSSTPAYFVGNIEQVSDEAMFAKYRAEAPKTEAAFGSHVIVRATPQKLDASEPPKGEIVIIQFPSMKALTSWWNSPAYAAVRPLREKSTVGHIYAVEGLPTP